MLTVKQKQGLSEIRDWFTKERKQIFTLAGYAGTGKSFLTQYAIESLNLKRDDVAFCTFTGKAALVLMKFNKGLGNISTIHRLVYDFEEDDKGEIIFKLKSDLAGIRLILVDEASMVSLDILEDLKSFGILILAIGDHGQLPAIGKQANLMIDPDFILDEIMRQAEGNPIIYLSMLARQGKRIDLGKYGDNAYVISKHDKKLTDALMLRADQVLCGYNRTRVEFNKRLRYAKGMKSAYPEFGDKVICLQNNWGKEVESYNLVNGMVGYVVNEPELIRHNHTGLDVMKISMQPDFLSEVFEDLYIPVADFTGEKVDIKPWHKKYLDRMTYGDVITTHKSQGSQWENILLWDEPFGDEPWRHTYTGITRASTNLIMAI